MLSKENPAPQTPNAITRNAISLDQLATLIAAELQTVSHSTDASARESGFKAICQHISQACLDDGFVEKHLPERKEGEADREVLYEDAALGFCICGHVYAAAAHGSPHDHGPSWAIYGQAQGETVMSDWAITDTQDDVKIVRETDTYTLKRGDVHVYDIGDVHSPLRELPVKLIRVEGENLDHIERSKVKAAES